MRLNAGYRWMTSHVSIEKKVFAKDSVTPIFAELLSIRTLSFPTRLLATTFLYILVFFPPPHPTQKLIRPLCLNHLVSGLTAPRFSTVAIKDIHSSESNMPWPSVTRSDDWDSATLHVGRVGRLLQLCWTLFLSLPTYIQRVFMFFNFISKNSAKGVVTS